LQENAAGVAVRKMLRQDWRTKIRHRFSKKKGFEVFRGFYGGYEATIYDTKTDEVVWRQNFNLEKDQQVDIEIQLP
jgi:hypothetical protein